MTRPQEMPDSLLRLFERPDPEIAVRLQARRPSWSELLGGRRLVVAAVLAPMLLWWYGGAAGGLTTVAAVWWLPLGLVAVLGALTLASYVPRREGGAGSSPCAALGGLYVLFAGMALDSPLAWPNLALALAFAAFGLRQRLRGADAC